jgi:ribosomal protein S18 acetylase RimI-like enzyme
MSSYRFCRTDDIALLVDAWNRCGRPHDPGAPPLTVEQFKLDIRELGLWCSSCMVAFDGADAVGVLIGCKRPPHTFVQRIAVHPDHLRKGHGRHLLTSLAAKLAILGPPHLVAEVSADDAPTRALFDACGWREQGSYNDLTFTPPASRGARAGVAHDASFDELAEGILPAESPPRAWERSRGTLLARAPRLRALAASDGDRLDASLLYSVEAGRGVSVWAIAHERDDAGEAALHSLLLELSARHDSACFVPRVGSDELEPGRSQELSLTPGHTTLRLGREAGTA